MRYHRLLNISSGLAAVLFNLNASAVTAVTPPSVTITSPSDGATWGQTSTFPVAASASDPDGSVSKVEFYLDGSLVTASFAPVQNTIGSYSGVLPTRPIAGTHTLQARAYDNDANVGTSPEITLQVAEGQLPSAITGAAITTSTNAQLTGTINAHGTQSACYFEIGTTNNYGTVITPSFGRGFESDKDQAAAAYVGVQRNTTYHFRFVAKNYAGTVYGDDVAFTTPQNLPPKAYDVFANAVGADSAPVFCDFEDPDGDAITVTAVSTPAHGTVTIGSSEPGAELTYTPDATFQGTDEFTYTVSDSYGATATATVRIANIRKEAIGRYVTTVVSSRGVAAGEVALNVTASGRFTGTMSFFGKRYPLRGQFSLDGYAPVQVDREGQPPITVNLGLYGGTNGIQLSGAFSAEHEEYELQQDPALIFPANAPEAGAYTIALPPDDPAVPQGNGYVTGHVLKHGQVIFTGVIGDGQAFSFGTNLRRGGGAQFFVMAGEAPRDRLHGRLQFPGAGAEQCTGTLVWQKAPRTSGYFQAGFLTTVQVAGSRFEPGPIDETLLHYSGELAELNISFTDPSDEDLLSGSLSGQTEGSLAFVQNLRARSVAKAPVPPVKVKVNRKKGTFSGTVTLPSDPKHPRSFSGVLLQHQNTGVGLVKLGGRTGAVTVSPK